MSESGLLLDVLKGALAAAIVSSCWIGYRRAAELKRLRELAGESE